MAFYREDKTPLYEGIEGLDVSFLENLSEGAHAYRFQDTPEGGSVLVGSVLEAGGKLYFLTQERRLCSRRPWSGISCAAT